MVDPDEGAVMVESIVVPEDEGNILDAISFGEAEDEAEDHIDDDNVVIWTPMIVTVVGCPGANMSRLCNDTGDNSSSLTLKDDRGAIASAKPGRGRALI